MADEPTGDVSHAGLSREQKIGFTLLLIFAIMSVSLGVLQIRNTLYAPFALGDSVPGDISSKIDPINALRYRDTDGDGLSDFDELYIYHTSPYLYDTYSLGMSDKQMIEKGINPCPNGQDCSNPVISGIGVPTSTQDDTVANAVANGLVSAGAENAALGAAPTDLSKILSDPTQVRQLLIQDGVPSSTLAQISDSDLMAMVTQTLTSSTTASNISSIESLLQNNASGAAAGAGTKAN